MNRRAAIAITASLLFGATMGVAHADALQDIKNKGTVRIAVLDQYPPWGYIGNDMKPIGFDVDFANLIGQRLGVKVQLVATTGANRIPFLQTGKVDMIVACLGKNAEREKAIDFSAPYGSEFNGVFGPKDVKIANAKDLAGKTVGVARGSSEDVVLTRLAPAGTNILRYEDSSGSVQALYSGQVGLVAIGSTVAATLNKKDAGQQMEFKIKLAEEPAFVGIAKNEPQLLAELNAIIAQAEKDGTLNELSKKWFGLPVRANAG